MSRIYEPKGAALEYSPLAANLYNGCSHGCTYCYAPACLHMTRENFRGTVRPTTDALKGFEKDARSLAGDPRPVLLCFTCDPYQPADETHKLTRWALHILGENRLHARVLTKNGRAARRDFDLFRRYDVGFGQTIIWSDDMSRLRYEPGAGTLSERYAAARDAHAAGICTWVSVEPVFDPVQALQVMDDLAACIDIWKIGKLNHDAARERLVDWRGFARAVLEKLEHMQCGYLIKNALWEHADAETKTRWPKERPAPTSAKP